MGVSERAESAETGGKRAASLLVHLGIVGSAYNTPQQMIRFSDEKESFSFLFFVIILSIFGIRGDRILLILGRARSGRVAHFLVHYAPPRVPGLHGDLAVLRPQVHRAPPAVASGEPMHRRLSWGHDLLQHPEEDHLAPPGNSKMTRPLSRCFTCCASPWRKSQTDSTGSTGVSGGLWWALSPGWPWS